MKAKPAGNFLLFFLFAAFVFGLLFVSSAKAQTLYDNPFSVGISHSFFTPENLPNSGSAVGFYYDALGGQFSGGYNLALDPTNSGIVNTAGYSGTADGQFFFPTTYGTTINAALINSIPAYNRTDFAITLNQPTYIGFWQNFPGATTAYDTGHNNYFGWLGIELSYSNEQFQVQNLGSLIARDSSVVVGSGVPEPTVGSMLMLAFGVLLLARRFARVKVRA